MNTLIKADVHFTHFYLSDYKLSSIARHTAACCDVISAFFFYHRIALKPLTRPVGEATEQEALNRA